MTRGEPSHTVPARPNPPPDLDRLPAEPPPPAGALTGPPARQEAFDATGTIQVVVDARGRVEDIQIDQRWRSRLDPDGLVSALLDTYRTARDQAAEAFTMASLAARRAGAEPPAFDDGGQGSQAEPMLLPLGPGADREARWRRIREMRAQIDAKRGRLARVKREASEPREHAGPNGYLLATVQWGAVLSITGDARQMQYGSTEDLRRDALALLSLADRSLAT